MKLRNYPFYFTVALIALVLGLAWVGVYNFFLKQSLNPQSGDFYKTVRVAEVETNEFDINDPDSVLPIDFEEDKLTSPHEDENNPKYFDPEGYYSFERPTKGFEDFFYIAVKNKNFDLPAEDERYGEEMPPRGHIILRVAETSEVEYIDFQTIEIADGKMSFETISQNGMTYEFAGEFLIKGNFYTLDEDTPVLKGILIKKKNGRTVAKSDFTFRWILEICC
jgi:hypothetical protein